ncbi:hypothetical protein ABW20_dc0110676 [Dactylellina cionopaga]|nr:hypothetical protein ABW20_dc0110676 [Dactylellina cionopaga]
MSAGSSPEPPQLVAVIDPAHTEAFGALGDLELEFEKAEVEVLKYQIAQTTPLYTRRNRLTTAIHSFWPTVFDSTPDFDQHIAPQDVPAISTITAVNVIRPNPATEPRDFIVELSFDSEKNEWFEDAVLTKRFWWKTVVGAWSGLVSEPVEVQWKEGKDLSGGETARKKKTLEERLAGGQPSFFTWFAWVGKGTDYGADGTVGGHVHGENCDHGHDEEDADGESDLFNHGDELALTIADDIYPNAIKYFLESLTGGNSDVDSDMSVSELDSDDEEVIVIGGEQSDDDEDVEDNGIGGSSGVKRHDITLSDEEEEEDEGKARRKRVKK